MSRDVSYEDLVTYRVACEHCGRPLSMTDVRRTLNTAVFGQATRKTRVLRCSHCGQENQLHSER